MRAFYQSANGAPRCRGITAGGYRLRQEAVMKRFALRSSLLAAALLSHPLPAAVANLLANPTFDANVNGWPATGDGVSYTTDNADTIHPAGSALVSNLGGAPGSVGQCVPVTSGVVYVFSGDIFVRPSSLGGSARVGLKFFSSPDCTSGSLVGHVSDSVSIVSV